MKTVSNFKNHSPYGVVYVMERVKGKLKYSQQVAISDAELQYAKHPREIIAYRLLRAREELRQAMRRSGG